MLEEHKQALQWYHDPDSDSLPAPVQPVDRSYEPSSSLSSLSSLTGLTNVASAATGYAVGYASTAYSFFTSVPQLAVDFVLEAIREENALRAEEKEDEKIVSPELNKLKAMMKIHSNYHINIENKVKLLKKEISRLNGYLLHIDSFRAASQVKLMMKKIHDYYAIRDKYYDRKVEIDEETSIAYGDDLEARKQEFEKMGYKTETDALKNLLIKLDAFVNFDRDDKYEADLDRGTEAIISYIIFADRFEVDRSGLDAAAIKERQQVCDDFILLLNDVKDFNPYSLKYYHPRILGEIYKRTLDEIITQNSELEMAELEYKQQDRTIINLANEFLAKQREILTAREANVAEQVVYFVRGAESPESNTTTPPASPSPRS